MFVVRWYPPEFSCSERLQFSQKSVYSDVAHGLALSCLAAYREDNSGLTGEGPGAGNIPPLQFSSLSDPYSGVAMIRMYRTR
jgi:hypothetical protein